MIPIIAPIIVYLFAAFTSPFVALVNKRLRSIYIALAALVSLGIVVSWYDAATAGASVYWLGAWVPTYTIYGITLVLDGLSWFFAFIISFLAFLVAVYSYSYVEKDKNLAQYYFLFPLLCAGMTGIVLTGDLFNMFVFLEISAISSIGLVAFRRDKKALSSAFNYLMLGAIATAMILVSIMLLYGETGTLNMAQVAEKMNDSLVTQVALALFIAGFAIESAMVPVHNWLPDAHSGAPSSISAMLSGVIVKMGLYGLLRLLFTVYIITGTSGLLLSLGLASMFAGGVLALLQNDFKRMLAYSTISQLGYVVMGIGLGTTAGLVGGLFHLANHAVFKGLLFLTAGAVLKQTGIRDLNRLGGLAKNMPLTTIAFAVGAMAISGVPPFNGFASKWILYNASFEISPLLTVVALFVSGITLAYFLKAFHGAFLGNPRPELKEVKEVPLSMTLPMLFLALLCIVMGLFPDYFIDTFITPMASALADPSAYYNAVMVTP